MQEKQCIRCVVKGKVQGVWFRAGTQDTANALGIKGWVRNLPDGNVEVLACGEKDKLQEFSEWLKKGPELAKVTEVSCDVVAWEDHNRFGIK